MSEWISVKDRLPEHGRYLVYCESFIIQGEGYLMIASYFCDEMKTPPQECLAEDRAAGWWDWADEWGWYYKLANVTHWMPLPEPPKEG